MLVLLPSIGYPEQAKTKATDPIGKSTEVAGKQAQKASDTTAGGKGQPMKERRDRR
ncbi:MAG: hypothetical protein NTW28_29150 [Candidatus Solibacter sp.]|nr:hypothetical protein [Candidatus Solibacter sp.]